MPTICGIKVCTDRTQSIKTVESNRSRQIDYSTIARAKRGDFGVVKFVGTEEGTGKPVFTSANQKDPVILPVWGLVQRQPATEAREYEPLFTLGDMKGLSIGKDVVVAITNWLWDNYAKTFTFAESGAQTISVRKADGTYTLRENSTDLYLVSVKETTKKSKKQ